MTNKESIYGRYPDAVNAIEQELWVNGNHSVITPDEWESGSNVTVNSLQDRDFPATIVWYISDDGRYSVAADVHTCEILTEEQLKAYI